MLFNVFINDLDSEKVSDSSIWKAELLFQGDSTW